MAQDCSNTGVGFTPIPDMGVAETYNGHLGRLYVDSGTPTNIIPAAHAADLAAASATIQKLDSSGSPSPSGRIVVLSVGMSNTNQKFAEFVRIVPDRNQSVILVNGAQSNRDAASWVDPGTDVWGVVDTRLAAKGVTNDQVQVIWIEQAIAGATGDFNTHLAELKGYLKSLVQELTTRFPNCKIMFFSPRAYGGYSTTGNPEPYAYETGFAVRDLINDQVNSLDVDLAAVPPMAWATYLDGSNNWQGAYWWADGETANSIGLQWFCSDYESDGLHPAGDDDGVAAPNGAEHKCAALLKSFFQNSPYTSSWWFPPVVVTTHATHSVSTPGNSVTVPTVYTPSPNTFQVVAVFARPAIAATSNQPTVTGHSLTYAMEVTRVFSTEATPRARITVFRTSGSSPTSGQLAIDFGGQNQSVVLVVAMELSSIYTGGVNAASGVTQRKSNSADGVSSLSINMDAETVESAILAVFANIINAGMTERDGWAEPQDFGNATTLSRIQVQFLDEYDSIASSSRSGAGTMNFGGVAIGLRNPPPNYLLEVFVVGGGTVTSSPVGIDCVLDCSEEYVENTVVTLTATEDTGYTFAGWSGDYDSAVGNECTVTMNSAKSITAIFLSLDSDNKLTLSSRQRGLRLA